MKPLPLRTFRLRNFKAVRDSGALRFTPLTVLIGNNGSGKSSLIEGMFTLKTLAEDGLDAALQQWKGFEHIYNKTAVENLRKIPSNLRGFPVQPMDFELAGVADGRAYRAKTQVAALSAAFDRVAVVAEELSIKSRCSYIREGQNVRNQTGRPAPLGLDAGASLLGTTEGKRLLDWQFLSLVPQNMGRPKPQKRTSGPVCLLPDGSNIAEYLQSIRDLDTTAFNKAFEGIVDALRFVLPYAQDLQPAITSELERSVYLALTESEFKVPGWLLSTGTLRLVALLACLRHPKPPSVLIIEEIENGLDPRSVHMVLEEIRDAVQEGRTQVIATTHSPYLLDLLPLETLMLVAREKGGSPTFWRPSGNAEVRKWAKDFAPGQLYTTGRFKRW